MRTYEREAPHNSDAEASVIGALMLDPSAADEVVSYLEADDFYVPAHRLMFRAAVALRGRGQPVGPIEVKDELARVGRLEEAGGEEYMVELVDSTPTAANVTHHATMVRDAADRRRLIEACNHVAAAAYDAADTSELMDRAESLIFGATQGRSERDGLLQLSSFLSETMAMITQGRVKSVSTGFRALDEITRGLRPGNLWIVAGRPAMGKSALATQIASNVALEQNAPAAIFSLEMGRQEALMRLLSTGAKVNLRHVVQGRADRLSKDDLENLERVAKRLQAAPLFIDDEGALSLYDLRARCRRIKAAHGLEVVVVDYLQLMRGRGDSRTQEVGSISRGLKALAGELEIPVIALSQLNRGVEHREDKRPMMSDLRDSGEIEQDADAILFLYRDSYYNPARAKNAGEEQKAEVIVGKQRNGPTGTVYLGFDEQFATFRDWSKMRKQEW